MLSIKKILFLSMLLFGLSAYTSALPVKIVDLIGDKDQEILSQDPEYNDDGWDVIHEDDDPDGFDIRQVGTTVTWTHDISDWMTDIVIESMRLDIAVLGLIDGNWPDTDNEDLLIDNKLYVNGTEIQDAFDDSYDGWRLYSFDISTDMLINGCLNYRFGVSQGRRVGRA